MVSIFRGPKRRASRGLIRARNEGENDVSFTSPCHCFAWESAASASDKKSLRIRGSDSAAATSRYSHADCFSSSQLCFPLMLLRLARCLYFEHHSHEMGERR